MTDFEDALLDCSSNMELSIFIMRNLRQHEFPSGICKLYSSFKRTFHM